MHLTFESLDSEASRQQFKLANLIVGLAGFVYMLDLPECTSQLPIMFINKEYLCVFSPFWSLLWELVSEAESQETALFC